MSYPQYPAAPAYPPPPAQQPPSGYVPGHPAAQPAYPGQQAHPAQAPYPPHAPYPGQAAYPGQEGYPAQPVYPGQTYPTDQPGGWAQAASATPQLRCRFCDSGPAVKTTFRGHQGMVVIMRFLSEPGPYCRDCGLATFREMTSRTLVQGWWGYISFLATPLTVLWNLIVSRKVRNLPAPVPTHPQLRPMDPGPRLLMRPMTIVGLAIPFALFILLMLVAVTGS